MNLQQFKHQLILLPTFVMYVVISLTFPQKTQANTIEPWGSNIVCHGNETTFRKIKELYGGDNWYPVTVLFAIVEGDETDVERINDILEWAHQYKIYPIMRIGTQWVESRKTWIKLDPNKSAQVLNQLTIPNFPDKLMVIYGNETNMNREWDGSANPIEYKASFESFVSILDKTRYRPFKAPVVLSYPAENRQIGYGGQEFYEILGGGLNTHGLNSHAYDVFNYNQGVRFPGRNDGLCGTWVGSAVDIDNTLEIDKCFHQSLGYPLKPFIATEFGLGPDLDMYDEQGRPGDRIKFLEKIYSENTSGYRDLDIVTPLLLDDKAGQVYPLVPVFTANKEVKYLDCVNLECGGVEACVSGSYDPDYNYEKKLTHNDYLTVPLILKPENFVFEKNTVNKLVWNMVVDQGYEVSCASPELNVTGSAIGKLMDYFSENNHSGPGQFLELSGSADYEVGMHNSVIPMYRDLDKKSLGKTASYEAFFGTLNDDYSGITQPGENVLHTGVANNLLTLSQQCRLRMNNMRVARDLCNRLQDKESCILHSAIPNSNFYLFSTPTQESIGEKSLLNTLESWNSWDPYNEEFGCSQLMSEYSAEYDSLYQVSEVDFNSAQQAMLNTSIDLERVYRYAFVVVSPLQNEDERCYGKNPEDKFWFLNDRQQVGQDNPCMGFAADNQKKRVPIFIGIKIPTLATNDIESLSLKNTASITANILTKLDLQDNKVEILNSRIGVQDYGDRNLDNNSREVFLSQVKEKMEIWKRADQDELMELIINCHGIPTCMGAHGTGTELRLALVHIINGSGVTCKGGEFFTGTTTIDKIMGADNPAPHGSVERAGNIGSPALQNLSPQRIFLDEYFNVREPSAKSHKWQWNIRLDKPLAQQLVDDGNQVISESVLIHMVAPLGAELKYIEGRLASLFTSGQLELIVDNNVMVDTEGIIGDVARYFPIQDTHLQFESGATHHYQHVECNDIIDPITGISTGAKENCEPAGVKLSEENVGLYIQGAKLGWLIRNIQQAITRYGESLDSTHAYVASCQRIEDLFLGKCGTQQYGVDHDYTHTSRSPAPNSCVFRGQLVAVPSECALVKMILDKSRYYEIDPEMIFGLIKIENPGFLRAVQNNQTEVSCAVNACGAIGPFQILQGVCVDLEGCKQLQSQILGGEPDDWEDFVVNRIMPISRAVNPCIFEEALDWTLENLHNKKSLAQARIVENGEPWAANLSCRLAGYHWGDASCAPNVSRACKGQSYCQCACEETVDVGKYNLESGGSFNEIRRACGL